MSTKSSKKNVTATKTKNAIVTRNKSAQNGRQLRAKNKKSVKPVIVQKEEDEPETKSTNLPTETLDKGTPLQNKVRHLVQLVEQVEYYPNNLKRDMGAKKTFLRPKHNFKLIASTNKRKSAVPKKGESKSSPPSKEQCGNTTKSSKTRKSSNHGNHTSDISMVDMVKLIEANHTLSDEDFMEILTCPSPVWWEDPPDEGYFEDAICTRVPSPTSHTSKKPETTSIEETINYRVGTQIETPCIDVENEIQRFNIIPESVFTKKKQKLESLLRTIKTDKQNDKHIDIKTSVDVNNKKQNGGDNKNKTTTGKGVTKNVSNTTDEEDMSELSSNEEEVLANLENMDIPIEQKPKIEIFIEVPEPKLDNELIKNEVIIPNVLPPLKRKPDIKLVNKRKSEYSDSNLDYNLDIVSHSNFRFISDDDINIVESNVNMAKKMKIVDISSSLADSSSIIDVDDMKDYEVKKELIDNSYITDGIAKNNEHVPKKIINDLSEYITVYKILSNDSEKNELNKDKSNKSPNSSDSGKLEKVRGKLNNFFKKCKNKRTKKTDNSFPSISVRKIKDLKKENSDTQSKDEENRLKTCDYCVIETINGTKKFSCDKCERTPIFACDLCNFLAETKELYTKHISKCKDVARITWKNNFIMNQT